MNRQQITPASRLVSMFLDHAIMCFIVMIPVAPFMALKIIEDTTEVLPIQSDPYYYAILFGMSLYLCKDCIGGRSIAKRILKYQVVKNNTNEAATPLQCAIRNFFCMFWPIEVIVTFFNPQRRIGDRVAGTRIVHWHPGMETRSTNFMQVAISLLVSFVFLFLITMPLNYL